MQQQLSRPHLSALHRTSSSNLCCLPAANHAHDIPKRSVCLRCISGEQDKRRAAAQDVVAVVEQDPTAAATQPAQPQASLQLGASSATDNGFPQEAKYKAVLAIISKLIEQEQQQPQGVQQEQQQQQQSQGVQQQKHDQAGQQQQRWQKLEAFLRSQPVATSIPFISWLADMEATETGGRKALLAQLCEVLVVLREQQDREGQEALYADTLRLLSGGDEQAVSLMSAEPRAYALALAEGVTGQALVLQGYGPAVDALLQVAPPAALTPEAVAQGHALAEELGADLSKRRKSTVAAMLGRVQLDSLSPEQQAALMGPSPAARILDLLLSLPDSSDRLALLPDCFTPSPDAVVPPADAEDGAAAAAAAGEDEETDELWCTPMQLLNEVERRLNATAAAAGAEQQGAEASSSSSRPALSSGSSSSSSRSEQQAALPPPPGGSSTVLSDAELIPALQQLRDHIQQHWLQTLPKSSTR